MLTEIQRQKIADTLAPMHLPTGLGDRENACSIAAINLALSGELTDDIPDCMSEVIGNWIIRTQDAMPDVMRNGAEWKRLLPLAAGTGRDLEKQRLDILLAHMWGVSLPLVQPIADKHGFGDAWRTMLTERTSETAEAAETASASAAWAAWAAKAAASASAAWAAASASAAAARAAKAAETAAARAAKAAETAWDTINPCGLLAELIACA